MWGCTTVVGFENTKNLYRQPRGSQEEEEGEDGRPAPAIWPPDVGCWGVVMMGRERSRGPRDEAGEGSAASDAARGAVSAVCAGRLCASFTWPQLCVSYFTFLYPRLYQTTRTTIARSRRAPSATQQQSKADITRLLEGSATAKVRNFNRQRDGRGKGAGKRAHEPAAACT